MRRRDVNKLVVGDHIELKHNLGSGAILKVLMVEDKAEFETIGRYPMIKFTDSLTGSERYCTYLMIESYHLPRT